MIVRKNFSLNFGTNGEQSVWDAGVNISDNRFLGLEWNTGEQAAGIDIYGYGAGVRGSTSGQIGLQSNFQVSGGSVNAYLPIDLWLDVPNKVQAGDIVTINSGFTLNPGATFSTTGPTASYTLDGIFGLNASAQAFVGGNNTDLLPPVSFKLTVTL